MRDARLGWVRGSAVRYAPLGWARGSVVRDACAHGRIRGSVAMHRLVAHKLNFMDTIEPCG